MASSIPGMATARSWTIEGTAAPSSVPGAWNQDPYPKKSRDCQTLIDHLLERGCRVDLHCKQVIEAIDLGGVFTELLAKRI